MSEAVGDGQRGFLQRPRVHQTLLILFTGMVLACWGTAAYTWRLRCEGFGCIGVGIAWAMWSAVLCGPTLLLGWVARHASSKSQGSPALLPRWWPQVLLWLHLGLGAALGLYWVVARLR